MHKVPGEVIKAQLRYRCKSCGAEEMVGDGIVEWQMIGEPPFLRSGPKTDFGTGRTGYVLPPPIIWHECYAEVSNDLKSGALGYGICELVGLVPIKDKKLE